MKSLWTTQNMQKRLGRYTPLMRKEILAIASMSLLLPTTLAACAIPTERQDLPAPPSTSREFPSSLSMTMAPTTTKKESSTTETPAPATSSNTPAPEPAPEAPAAPAPEAPPAPPAP